MQRIDRDVFKIDKRRCRGLAKGLVLFAAVLLLVFGATGAYADQVCSECHDASTSGPCQHGVCDGGNCAACHGNPPVDAGGLIHPYADQPSPVPTGSVSAGAHAIHAGVSGSDYGCDVCHYGGMKAGVGIIGNNKIQIGFSITNGSSPNPLTGGAYDGSALNPPYTYEATNGTTVTTGGTKKCSGMYCHSDGTSLATGVIRNYTSPAWDSGGPLDCDVCHGFPPSYSQGQPKANSHMAAGHYSQTCNVCHYATTADGTTITDFTRHKNANGVYEVVADPTVTSNGIPVAFAYSYDANGGTCSAVSCHGGVALQWGAVPTGAVCSLCHTGHTTGHMATDGSGHPVPDACASCHTQYVNNAHTGTTRNLSNSCGTCHVTTGLSFISHNSVPMTAVSGQCTTCHIGMITTHAAHTGGTAHTLTTEATCTICHSATPRVRPTAAIMAACTTCHGNKQVNHIDVGQDGPQLCTDCHYVGGAAANCTGCHGNRNGSGMHSGTGPFAAFSASAGSGIDAWKVTLNTFGSIGTISSVNWGDGTTDSLTTHTYTSAGDKSITLYVQTASVAHSITLIDYPISGTVKRGGVGLGNVTITLTGPTSGTTVTDSSGAYSFLVRPGTYSVRAAKAGYTMSADVTSIVAAPGKTDANFTAQPQTAALTVSKANSTYGSVSSTPTGISCDAPCSGPSTATFDVGSVVRLTASISTGNTVNRLTCTGGTAATCGGTSCYSDVTIASGGNSCTAVFSDSPYVVKRVSGAADSYYLNLEDGLNAAVNGDILYLKGIIFNENVTYDKTGVGVTLKGGYDDLFSSQADVSTIYGSMTVVIGSGPGSASVNKLIIQSTQ